MLPVRIYLARPARPRSCKGRNVQVGQPPTFDNSTKPLGFKSLDALYSLRQINACSEPLDKFILPLKALKPRIYCPHFP